MNTDTEPKTATTEIVGLNASKLSRGSGLGALKRELTPKDLNDNGAKKMLLNLVDALESENADLKSTVSNYHKKDKALAVLQARYDGLLQNNIMKGLFSSLGWTIVGFISFIYEKKWGWGVITVALIVAAGLIIIPLILTAKGSNSKDAKDEA